MNKFLGVVFAALLICLLLPTSAFAASPLVQAAYDKDPIKMNELIKLGEVVKGENGTNALFQAIYSGCDLCVNILLKSGVSANIADDDGWTALMKAASNLKLEIVKNLLAKNANVNAVTKSGETPLMTVFLKYGDNKIETEIAKLLLAKGANAKYKSASSKYYYGKTPLIVAARSCNAEMVQILIAKGVDVNSKLVRKSGDPDALGDDLYDYTATALVNATLDRDETGDCLKVIKMLVAAGAKINEEVDGGKHGYSGTAWSIANIVGNKEIAAFLEQKGADTSE